MNLNYSRSSFKLIKRVVTSIYLSTGMFPAFSASSYMERLLRDGGDLDSMDRSLFSCDVSRCTVREFRLVHTGGKGLFI